ncbi:MAG: hypothetical protein ABIA63_12110 [bacterium]
MIKNTFSIRYGIRDHFCGVLMNLSASVFILICLGSTPLLKYFALCVVIFETSGIAYFILQSASFDFQAFSKNAIFGRIPLAYTQSLLVTLFVFHDLIFMISVFWVIIGIIFNINLFRSTFLKGF